MAFKGVFMDRALPFGWTLCQYWPGEVILKHPKRKRGVYIKMPWCRWQDRRRWLRFNGEFVLEADVNPRDEAGHRLLSVRHWPEAYRYALGFRYTTRRGVVQKATLTAYRDRVRTVAWWLRWVPWAGRDSDRLLIEFSDEMGSEAGSWKGGVVGTSCDAELNESTQDAVQRFLDDAQANYRWCR